MLKQNNKMKVAQQPEKPIKNRGLSLQVVARRR